MTINLNQRMFAVVQCTSASDGGTVHIRSPTKKSGKSVRCTARSLDLRGNLLSAPF